MLLRDDFETHSVHAISQHVMVDRPGRACNTPDSSLENNGLIHCPFHRWSLFGLAKLQEVLSNRQLFPRKEALIKHWVCERGDNHYKGCFRTSLVMSGTQISTLLAGRQSWAYQTSKGRTFNNLGFHQRTKAHWLPRNSHGLTLPILHESTTTAQRNTWTSQTTDAYINYNLSKVNFIESVPGWGHELHLTWKLKTVIFT